MRETESFDKAKAGLLRVFCPDVHVKRVTDIHPATLLSMNIRFLMLDLDNTLTPWRSHDIPQDIRAWVEEMKAAGIGICIVSNTRNFERLSALSNELGIRYVREKMKPSRAGYLAGMELLGCGPDEVAMAGDQLFTDVWGANRSGIISIWVERLHEREFFGTKISRVVERAILWFLRMRGVRKSLDATG